MVDPFSMQHLFIVNPHSFRSAEDMDTAVANIRQYFTSISCKGYFVHISRYPRDAIGVVRHFAEDLDKEMKLRIYPVGGDGTIFDCLNAAMGLKNVEIAPVPYGHINDFALSFGESAPESMRDIEAQATGEPLLVDVIKCNNYYAFEFCSFGMESVACDIMFKGRQMSDYIRNAFPWYNNYLSYIAGIGAWVGKNHEEMTQCYNLLIDDDELLIGNFPSINISNTRFYGDGKIITPHAVSNDGYLDMVYLKHYIGIGVVLSKIGTYFRGKYAEMPDLYDSRRFRKVFVTSDKPMHMALDGEVFFAEKAHVEVIPNGMNVVASRN
ncbi:lipid kinase [Clostridia bacterium]|nr:lipid kinase [Clostridia bacterium]